MRHASTTPPRIRNATGTTSDRNGVSTTSTGPVATVRAGAREVEGVDRILIGIVVVVERPSVYRVDRQETPERRGERCRTPIGVNG